MGNYLKFVVVSGLNHETPYDVICFQSYEAQEAYWNWIKTQPWIATFAISLEDARKLVEQRGGIGIGCYTPDHSERLTEARRAMADLKGAGFMEQIGHKVIYSSYCFDMENMKAKLVNGTAVN